jgi:hypothetical protein
MNIRSDLSSVRDWMLGVTGIVAIIYHSVLNHCLQRLRYQDSGSGSSFKAIRLVQGPIATPPPVPAMTPAIPFNPSLTFWVRLRWIRMIHQE